MLDFPSKTINSIKKLLLRQQREVEKDLKEIDEDDPLKAESLAESSEPGTDSYLADTHSRIMVLKSQLFKTSGNIRNALVKIRKGIYGKCENCGNKIELGRLFAMPTASLCLSCSRKIKKI